MHPLFSIPMTLLYLRASSALTWLLLAGSSFSDFPTSPLTSLQTTPSPHPERIFFLFKKQLFIYLVALDLGCCITWHLLLWRTDSLVVVRGLSSCGAWAQLLHSMWDLSSLARDKPAFPELQGGFLTTGPPGKSRELIFLKCMSYCPSLA